MSYMRWFSFTVSSMKPNKQACMFHLCHVQTQTLRFSRAHLVEIQSIEKVEHKVNTLCSKGPRSIRRRSIPKYFLTAECARRSTRQHTPLIMDLTWEK